MNNTIIIKLTTPIKPNKNDVLKRQNVTNKYIPLSMNDILENNHPWIAMANDKDPKTAEKAAISIISIEASMPINTGL